VIADLGETRSIHRFVRTPLSVMLAEDEFKEGGTVAVGLRRGELTFRRRAGSDAIVAEQQAHA